MPCEAQAGRYLRPRTFMSTDYLGPLPRDPVIEDGFNGHDDKATPATQRSPGGWHRQHSLYAIAGK